MIYNINIKALQTDKKKKSSLALGKCTIKSLLVKSAIDYAGEQCGEKFNAPAEFLFQLSAPEYKTFMTNLMTPQSKEPMEYGK